MFTTVVAQRGQADPEEHLARKPARLAVLLGALLLLSALVNASVIVADAEFSRHHHQTALAPGGGKVAQRHGSVTCCNHCVFINTAESAVAAPTVGFPLLCGFLSRRHSFKHLAKSVTHGRSSWNRHQHGK
jgi:hypothetical protein